MRRILYAVLGVILTIGLYLGLASAFDWWPFNDHPNEAVANLNPTSRELCATKVHFYANDPGKAGPNDNGPAYVMVGSSNVERTTNFLIQRHNHRCEDAALVVEHEVARGLVPYSDASARIAFYLAEREEWRKAVERLEAPEALATKEIGTMTNDYWSFFMRPGTAADPRPTIGQDQLVKGTKSTMLRMTITLPDGKKIIEESRMECGDQISGAKAFRDIPRMSELPTRSTTTNVAGPPPSTPTNTPPVTTTTVPPENGKNPALDAGPQGNNPGRNGQAPIQQDPEGPPQGGQPPADYESPVVVTPTTVPRPPAPTPPVVVDPEPSHTSVTPPPEDW